MLLYYILHAKNENPNEENQMSFNIKGTKVQKKGFGRKTLVYKIRNIRRSAETVKKIASIV